MRTRLGTALALAVVGFVVAGVFPLVAAAQAPATSLTVLQTNLTGAAEVPGPGDPDGSGRATLIVLPDQGRLCFVLRVQGVDPITAAHVHVGGATQSGGVVVPLDPPPTHGASGGCVQASEELLNAIAGNPSNYYVNVHNAAFAAGALRGQLPD
jgi:hypothetical protein